MSPVLALLALLGTLLMGAISPGPSFVMVARIAAAGTRRDGFAAALGMGLGGVCFAVLALVGLQAVLMRVIWLYLALKLVGGAYLVYLAVRLWRGAPRPLVTDGTGPGAGSPRRAFWVALGTQLSNPKAAIVYTGIFAALMPADAPLWMQLAIPPLVFVVECGWYTVVGFVFSAARPRAAYLGAKAWIDRLAGGIIAGLGLRLIATARL